MLVKLDNGLTLLLPDSTPLPLSRQHGYFVLSGEPCDDPDLSVTPAFYAVCPELSDVFDLHQYELVIGRGDQIIG